MKRTIVVITLAALLALSSSASRVGANPPGVEPSRISSPAATYDHFFLTPDGMNPWSTSHTVVDASGGVHTAFYTHAKIYYAYCSANCGDTNNWEEAPVGDTEGSGSSLPALAIDPNNHPRLMWWTINGRDYIHMYAECDTNCTSTANWTAIPVPVAETAMMGGCESSDNARFFSLDTQGRPRMVCPAGNGFWYAACDSSCTTSSNWQAAEIDIDAQRLGRLQLLFNASHQPRLMGYDGVHEQLVYLACDTNCLQSASWSHAAVYDVGGNPYPYTQYSFRLNAQGHPRLFFNASVSSEPSYYYAWSNANSTSASGWSRYALTLETGDPTFDLALDTQGRPQVAYSSKDFDLGYLTCTANCESEQAAWQSQLIETGDELNASDPIPVSPGCTVSTWFIDYPSLALDTGDNPNVSYFVRNVQLCNSSLHYDHYALRFARPHSGSSTSTPPASVGLSSPAIGVVGNSYTLTATVSPITATTPITYVWQATGLTTQTHTGRGTSDTATFTWPLGATGVKTITVSTGNQAGAAHGNSSILISATPIVFNHWVYLPAIRKP